MRVATREEMAKSTMRRRRKTTASGYMLRGLANADTYIVLHIFLMFQIYYCSRTHSQLSQFVKEIQKSPFSDNVRLVPLASRNIMCINESVKKLGGNALINERCLEMQQKSSKATNDDDAGDKAAKVQRRRKKTGSGRCPFHKQSTIENLRDQALLKVLDIEELVSHGKRLNACPYYASRHATNDAQIIGIVFHCLISFRFRIRIRILLSCSPSIQHSLAQTDA